MVKVLNIFPGEPLGPETSVGILESKIYSEDELARRKPGIKILPYTNESGTQQLVIFGYDGNLESEMQKRLITKEKAMQMLEAMLLGRELEKMSVMLTYKSFGNRYGSLKRSDIADITFPTHLAIGHEAMSVGSIFAIDADDYITSTHRGHIDAMVKGYRTIVEMSNDRLAQLLEQNKDIASRLDFERNPHLREQLLMEAVDIHIYRTIAELFGKKDGYCNGKGGGMHLAWCDVNNLGNNAIVGGMTGIAVGSGIASKFLQDGRTTLAIVGDGGYINENSFGAVNMATMSQFRNGAMSTTDGPHVVFVCYNNQYAMTCQQRGEVTSNRFLSQRYIGFNEDGMHAETAFGMDVLAVHDLIRSAKSICDHGKGPVFSELWGYRFFGHSLSDDALGLSGNEKETYRHKGEILEWKNYDPISLFASQVVNLGLLSIKEFRALETETESRVQRLAFAAAKADFPQTSEMFDGLYTKVTSENVPIKFASPKSPGPKLEFKRDSRGRINYSEAVREAIAQEMRRDLRVRLFGEDLAEYGGAFGETEGLWQEFGFDRVFNTCLCEANIAGIATGMALRGLRPIAKASMYIDFFTQALDQIANHAAKLPYMSGGQLQVPAVFWTDMGGGMGYAGQHSQNLETMITMFPGLKVVAPSTAYDAKGLMIAAIRDDNPVVVIGHQNLYKNIKCDGSGFVPVPEEPYALPIGKANLVKKMEGEPKVGQSITIVSYSWMLYSALQAAEALEKEGHQPEVIDLRTLSPLDMDTISYSLSRTGRLVIAHQACVEGGLGQQIACKVISEGWFGDHGRDLMDYL